MIETIDVLRLTELLPELPKERTRLLDNLGRIRREVGPAHARALRRARRPHEHPPRRGARGHLLLLVPRGARWTPSASASGPSATAWARRSSSRASRSTRTASRCSASSAWATATSRPCSLRGDRRRAGGRPPDERRALDRPRAGATRRWPTTRRAAASRSCATCPPNETIVEELKASGLTGYGGAGFPTGRQVGGGRPGAGAALRRRQRRRGRAGDDQGPLRDGAAGRTSCSRATLIAMDFAEATEGFIYLREEYATARERLDRARRGVPRRRPPRRALARARRRRRRLHLRRGDGDARVDGGPARDAAPQAAVPEPGRLPRPPDAHQQRRDPGARPGDPARAAARPGRACGSGR